MANYFLKEIVPWSALRASRMDVRLAQIARSGCGEASAEAALLLVCVATLRRSSFDAMVASGVLRAAFDAFVDKGATEHLLVVTLRALVNALVVNVGSWIDDDVKESGGADVDRDCRQALARFLLLPANADVMCRMGAIVAADKEGANGPSNSNCAAYLVSEVVGLLKEPVAVGPQLAAAWKAWPYRLV